MRSSLLIFVPILVSLASSACSADAENTGSEPAVAGTSTGSSGSPSFSGSSTGGSGPPVAGSTNGNGGGTSSSGSGSGPSAGTNSGPKPLPLALPFFVNAPGNFVKSGFMGDAMMSVTAAPSELDKDGACGGKRATGKPGGDCDTFKLAPSATGKEAWQGVFYQFPANNWGTFPGRSIASGAKAVKFQARASRSVAVLFQVGMCDPKDASKCVDGFFAYPDSADETGKITVGTEWTEVSVSLIGKDYSAGVHGAFSWAIANDDLLDDLSPLQLYLDAISWQ